MQNVVDILGCPYARGRHGLNEICTGKERNLGLLLALGRVNATSDDVDFMLKMVQDLCCLEIVCVESLPWIDC